MNFKPVVASLFALGLVSAPAMAVTQAKEQHKHQKQHAHHARHHEHHGVTVERKVTREYYAEERLLDSNSAKSPVATFDWVNRIHFSGIINVDAKYSSRAPLGIVPGFFHHDYTSELNVNNANLFVDVDVNHCVLAHIGVAYVADSVNLFDLGVNTGEDFTALTDGIRSDKGAVWSNGHLSVDEAYITIRDYSRSPFFLRAGKMYVPFGHNSEVYPITESFTQLLSQTRATTVQLGWVSNYGLYASVYALDGATSSFNAPSNTEEDDVEVISWTTIENWGAQLGYCGAYDDVRYHLSASYLKDIRDVEYLAGIQDLSKFNVFPLAANPLLGNGYRRSAGAAFHGDAHYGAYGLSVNYVTALRNLIRSNDDADRQVIGDSHHDTRISSADISGIYNTNVWGYNTGFSLAYDRSWQADPILPKWRIQGDVGVAVLPHTTVGLEYHYDRAYGDHNEVVLARQEEGNWHRHHHTRSSSTAAVRLGVVF